MSFSGFTQELPAVKTENHILIPGTNISMVPPKSFLLSGNFKGFQNPADQTSMIMVMEIPGPFSEVVKGFNAEMLQSKGMDLKAKKAIKVAGHEGFLIELNQEANGMAFSKHILVYGDEKSTMFINATYLKDSLELGKKMMESILTTIVDNKMNINPREALDYSLNEKVGLLQFKSVIGNGMLFNRDLKTPTESADKATLLTDKSFAKVKINNKKQFCISRVINYPGDFSVIPAKGINEIEVDDLKGFELYANNNETSNEEMYQVILFDIDGGYYLFIGSYLSGSKDAPNDIKKIISTFKRKK